MKSMKFLLPLFVFALITTESISSKPFEVENYFANEREISEQDYADYSEDEIKYDPYSETNESNEGNSQTDDDYNFATNKTDEIVTGEIISTTDAAKLTTEEQITTIAFNETDTEETNHASSTTKTSEQTEAANSSSTNKEVVTSIKTTEVTNEVSTNFGSSSVSVPGYSTTLTPIPKASVTLFVNISLSEFNVTNFENDLNKFWESFCKNNTEACGLKPLQSAYLQANEDDITVYVIIWNVTAIESQGVFVLFDVCLPNGHYIPVQNVEKITKENIETLKTFVKIPISLVENSEKKPSTNAPSTNSPEGKKNGNVVYIVIGSLLGCLLIIFIIIVIIVNVKKSSGTFNYGESQSRLNESDHELNFISPQRFDNPSFVK